MAEQEARFTLTLDGDASNLNAVFAAFKKTATSAVSDIEKTTNNVQLFKNATADLEKAQAAVDATRASLAKLRDMEREVQGAGESIGKDLAAGLKDAQRAANAAEKDFSRQTATTERLRASLTAAGVNVKALATEEIRLATALKQAEQAEKERQAASVLGIKLDRERTAELTQLRNAFNFLRTTGTATFNDLAAAGAAYRAKATEIETSTRSLFSGFQAVRASVLGVTAGIAGGIAVLKAGADASTAFELGLARINSVANLTDGQLRALGAGVRDLAQTAGFDLKKGLETVYDLLRQGVPVGNVLQVLADSDAAAKAGVTELGVAAKASGVLVKAFGVAAGDVKPELDKLFAATRAGGPTLDEFASGLGEIAPLAKATKTPLQDVVAVVLTLTRAGLTGSEALGAVQQILLRFATPEVAKRLADIGIAGDGLVDTLRKLGERGVGIEGLLGLEIASRKTATAVAALTSDSTKLAQSIAIVGSASGSIDKVAESFSRLRADAIERLAAGVSALTTNLGNLATPSAGTIATLAELVRLLNNAAEASQRATAAQGQTAAKIKETQLIVGAAIDPWARLQLAYDLVGIAAKKVNDDIAAAAAKTQEAAAGTLEAAKTLREAENVISAAQAAEQDAAARAAKARINEIRADLTKLVTELQESSKALLTLGTDGIAAVNQQAEIAIAALDKLRNSEIKLITERTAIEKKASDDRLSVIKKTTEQIIAAYNAEAQARRDAAGEGFRAQAKVEEDLAKLRRANLKTFVDLYESEIKRLIAADTQHLNKVAELNDQRKNLEQALQDKLRSIRQAGLSTYDAYMQNIRDVDEKISKARQAFAEGDFKLAEKYANEAIQLSENIKGGVESDGRSIVSALQAQELQTGKVKTAYDLLLGVNKERVEAEEDGAAATKTNLENSRTELGKYKTELDAVNKIIEAGLSATVTMDITSVKDAKAEIDSLNGRNTQSTHTVKVVVENTSGFPLPTSSSGGGSGEHFAAGGPVGELVSRFRRGGAVIRQASAAARETWGPVAQLLTKGGSAGESRLAEFFATGGPTDDPVATALRLQKVYGDLLEIVTAANQIPQAPNATNISDWAREVLSKFFQYGAGRQANIAQYVESNIDAWLSAIEEARRTRSPVLVDDRAKALAFERGGPIRRFARGGAVLFRRPAWTKVPGSGDGDTVPALLRAGSYVVRKAASRYYGDGLMARLAQGFATGGGVLQPGSGAGAILLGGKSKVGLGKSGFEEFAETISKLYELKEKSQTLPHSSTGLDLAEWAGRIIDRFPLFEPKRRERIRDLLEESFEGWLVAIENARKFRVPVVVAFDNIAALAYRKGGRGAGTDTVPAMLTPGEFVIQKPAVDRFGAGLLHAINNMRLPREALANMLSPPRAPARFAQGGQVGRAPITLTPRGGAAPAINLTFNVDGKDLLSEAQIQKRIIPAINNALRRSSKGFVDK